MHENELYTIALSNIPGIGIVGAHNLINALGDAKAIFENRKELHSIMPDITDRVIKALDCKEAFQKAEKELKFIEKNNIRCLTINSPDYPSRLRECDDAPIMLYYKGNANLNALHVINMVGTRHATEYGEDFCRKFISELAQLCPDVLIVSGLAYGIDICAHRESLKNNIATIGVLAHGLDRLYPQGHRKTAIEMIENGGLITEYMSGTNPDRQNFIKRNRIIAGMADATIVVESAAKGGALITADIAESYNRDCFAIPGRINDDYSIGCNELIRNNKASLLTSAQELVEMLNWETKDISNIPIQREMFPELSDEENSVVETLRKHTDGIQINLLVIETNIPINRITSILFELEMKGIVKVMAGGVYKLIM